MIITARTEQSSGESNSNQENVSGSCFIYRYRTLQETQIHITDNMVIRIPYLA